MHKPSIKKLAHLQGSTENRIKQIKNTITQYV